MTSVDAGVDRGMQVEIWSDVVCPWCYIGKRRFEAALARFAHAGDVTVAWRSFELDPSAPGERQGSMVDHLARKYGMGQAQAQAAVDRLASAAATEGLEFHLDRARGGNTFDAHRLLHLAAERGVQDGLKERLLRGYFTDGEPIGDPGALTRLAVDAGLDKEDVSAVLGSDAFADAVRADEAAAAELGITGVPCFVIDRRLAIPGAQDPDTILALLERAWDRRVVAAAPGDGSPVCDGDVCDLPG
jgi:predicted DsbA family dithiol-disulfide isomerase